MLACTCRRLKKVHGEFQKQMRRDAPKLVTFLHERVTSEEGAEWSLAISQAKPGPRYHLPEEVGVMPLLALNFDEDFGLLFKLVPVTIYTKSITAVFVSSKIFFPYNAQ